MVHGRGCNPHRSLWHHWWHHNSETIRDREKRRPPRPMKSPELSNGENRIALRQLLQNRKLRHLWRHNLGSRWKLHLQGPHSPYILGDTTRPRHITYVLVSSKSDQRQLRKNLHKQTNRQTNRHYENNGHLAVNQYFQSSSSVATSVRCHDSFNDEVQIYCGVLQCKNFENKSTHSIVTHSNTVASSMTYCDPVFVTPHVK